MVMVVSVRRREKGEVGTYGSPAVDGNGICCESKNDTGEDELKSAEVYDPAGGAYGATFEAKHFFRQVVERRRNKQSS
jgi:hypothetical protein